MAEQQEARQEQVTPTAEPESEARNLTAPDEREAAADQQPTPPVRPRKRVEAERVVEHGVIKSSQRQPRPETVKSRSTPQARRPGTAGEQIQRREKHEPDKSPPRAAGPPAAANLTTEYETLKWAAYGALLVSLIALLLLGVYSIRKFTPQFAFQEMQATQARMTAEIQQLQLALDLETVKRTIMNAYLQLLLHKDPAAAESILTTAKQDLRALLVALPTEQQTTLKRMVDRLDNTIDELRRPPAAIDQELKQILYQLDHL